MSDKINYRDFLSELFRSFLEALRYLAENFIDGARREKKYFSNILGSKQFSLCNIYILSKFINLLLF